MYNDDGYKVFSKEKIAQTKRKLKLDLNPGSFGKRARHSSLLNPLLTSPDLNMLKLASPELDKLVLQQVGGHHIFPQRATNEQEDFAKGFTDSLEQMHNLNSNSNLNNAQYTAGDSAVSNLQYTQLYPPAPVTSSEELHLPQIKEEPHTVPSTSPPMSPINMENQEKIKLERKRLRNRIAASKCRRRKLERIGRLEDKVSILKGENGDLQAIVNKLRDQVCVLKKEVMEHMQAGCQIPYCTHS